MRDRLIPEATAVGLLLGAVLVLVALLSHSPVDPSPFYTSSEHERPENLAGWLGANLSAALLSFIGLAALIIPIICAILGWRILRSRPIANPRPLVAGWALLFLALPGLLSLIHDDFPYRGGTLSCGGYLGLALGDLLDAFAGLIGRVMILTFLVVVGLLLVSGVSAAGVLDRLLTRLRAWWKIRSERRDGRRRQRAEAKDRQRVVAKQLNRIDNEDPNPVSVTVKELEGKGRFRIVRKVAETQAQANSEVDPPAEFAEPDASFAEPDARFAEPDTGFAEPDAGAAEPDSGFAEPDSGFAEPDSGFAEPDQELEVPVPVKASAAKRRAPVSEPEPEPAPPPVVQEEFSFIEEVQTYDLPRTSFLDPADEPEQRDSAAMIEISKLLTSKCQEFKVRGEVTNIRTGPVITTYEFRLDAGIKIAAVQNLSEDLALALRTDSVRIARIPGRATVGIEVPNPKPVTIRLCQLIEETEFARASSLLTLSLGVDIHGRACFADLCRMPHLLIGGFTGSGKSVGINAMIMSVLYKARPDQVRFIFVDPKMVELGVYSDIPHLLTPIITDPKKAANALGWAVSEMDSRYRRLAALGVRNLTQYNQLVEDPEQQHRIRDQLGQLDEGVEPNVEPLPLIVIIIDELADLMMTSSRAVEESITRLAQKARAVGVHLVCATQRPSVDILTGIIKANFPCRIAYKVRSKFDSRTILDIMGAEHLLGRGDMLYLPPGTSNLVRLHGPLVTEKEIATVVRYIKRFGKPDYLGNVVTHAPLGGTEKGGRRGKGARIVDIEEEENLTDPMFDQAARVVVKTRKASASYIQRRLHLGYTRSARLLDMMEKEGLVGALDGSKGREVLVPPNYFDEVDETHSLNQDDQTEEGTP